MGETRDAPGSFDAFAAEALPGLLRYAYLLSGNRHDAEDLVQSALVRVLSSWRRVRSDGNPVGYTRRTLTRLYIDQWRRGRGRETPQPEVPDTAATTSIGDDVASRHDALALLAVLPPGQRAVVVLRYYDDLSEAQTAEALSCSVGTVKSQLFKALRTLRRQLPSMDPAAEKGT